MSDRKFYSHVYPLKAPPKGWWAERSASHIGANLAYLTRPQLDDVGPLARLIAVEMREVERLMEGGGWGVARMPGVGLGDTLDVALGIASAVLERPILVRQGHHCVEVTLQSAVNS